MHGAATPRKTVAPQKSGASPLAFAALMGGNIAIAFGPWFVRLADTGPVAASFWRLTLATPVLLLMAFVMKPADGTPRLPALPRAFWVMTLLGSVCFAADLASWHLGILRTTLANAALFGNSTTLMFPIYGFVAARMLPTRTQATALLLAFAGAALLMGRSYELNPRHLGGDLLCILAGAFYTVYLALMTRVRVSTPPMLALALSTLFSVLPALLFALALGEQVLPHNWTPLIGLAFMSQVLGQSLLVYALGRFSPLVIGLALLVQPIVAASVGWLWYGEQLGVTDFVGAVLVAIALVLVRERAKPVASEVAKHQNAGGDA